MNHYHVWCNLKETHKDLEFAENVSGYLGHLEKAGKIAGYRLTRRKLGFGPAELGEFHIIISAQDLTQLEAAFDAVSAREGALEAAHAKVYSMVTDFRAALYRDFPDPQRGRPAKSPTGS